MFRRTWSKWISCAGATLAANSNIASAIFLAGRIDQLPFGALQLPAILRIHGFRSAARGLVRYAIPLSKFRKKRVGARQMIWHRSFRAHDLPHHFTGIRRDLLVQVEFVVGTPDEGLGEIYRVVDD